MSRRRTTMLGVLLAAGAVALTACQPSAGTAAYVGGQRITDRNLQAAVDEGLSAPGAREAAAKEGGGDIAEYRRSMLLSQVEDLLLTEAVRRTGVSVPDSDVRALINASGGEQDLRQRLHLSAAQLDLRARDRLLTVALGYKQGAQRTSEAVLRSRYADIAKQQLSADLALIEVTDRATLDSVVSQLKANPSRLAALANQYKGSQLTSATPRTFGASNLPPSTLDALLKAKPGDVLPYAEQSQFVAIRVFKVTVPSFEQLRPQLEQQVAQETDATAASTGLAYLTKLAGEIGVRVNPRYGVWKADAKSGTLTIDQAPNPLVTINGGPPTATPTPTPVA